MNISKSERDSHPLASTPEYSDYETSISTDLQKPHPKNNFKNWCVLAVAIAVITSVTVVVTAFIIFDTYDPMVKMNSMTIREMDTSIKNISMQMTAGVSIKNPNFAAFRYDGVEIRIEYGGGEVGRGGVGGGEVKGRGTAEMNLDVGVVQGKMTETPGFDGDVVAGRLTVRSLVKVGGRVKVGWKKMNVDVLVECVVVVNVGGKSVEMIDCKDPVYF